MDPGIRPPGNDNRHRTPQHHGKSLLNLPLNCPLPRLPGPPGEATAVVLDDESAPQTSSKKTISVESERLGPSFRIRV
jgi:hypothetical protein